MRYRPLRILYAGLSAWLACGLAAPFGRAEADNNLHVDPFLGTLGYGNVYPGVTVPFGFIQVSPDTGKGSGAAGYKFDKNINGFSQQHISGMAGPTLGQLSLFPLTGTLTDPANITSTGKSAESATPGYYTVTLAPWDVKVELAATRHVAFHRYTFPAHDQSRILVDAGHILYGTGGDWGSGKPLGGEVQINSANREVFGHMTYQGGRGSFKWKIFFSARFDTAFSSSGTWDDTAVLNDGSVIGVGAETGAYINLKTTAGQVVNARVAVSYRSLEQARGYLTDTAVSPDFEVARSQTAALWTAALSTIQIEGGTADQSTQFYTALYRVHQTPNDWTGESPERYGNRTYFENILCMWDTFRTVNPLLTLIQPSVQAGIVNTLLAYHQVDGWTGDAHNVHNFGHVQNGSNADVIIADAYVKKLPGIDWKSAYAAVRKNAFVDPMPDRTTRPHVGRFRLNDYRKLNYFPTDATASKTLQSVSRTLEYVYNDFSVYTMAKDLGTAEDVADLKGRLLWYKNHWDKDTGFMRGRSAAGAWHEPFDPVKSETGPQYYEGHAWTWSWYVPHDAQGLVNLLGGNEAFVKKLTIACDQHYQAWNEPAMLQTYFFTHAGRPDLTQFYIRKALGNFTTARNGLPGNDDSGTTSAWIAWALLGIYPNAGQDFYYIGSPAFTKATVQLADGKKLVISAPAASATKKYISAATLNGKPWNQAWLRHSDFINGAALELTMSDQPSKWGTQTPPPSYSPPTP